MKDKIDIYDLAPLLLSKDDKRLAQCWNILRTCTDEQLIAMEKQVDLIIESGEAVGVCVGPELPF